MKLVVSRAPEARPEELQQPQELPPDLPRVEEEPFVSGEVDPFSAFSPEGGPVAPRKRGIPPFLAHWELPDLTRMRPVTLVVLVAAAILLGGYATVLLVKGLGNPAGDSARLSVSSNPSGTEVLLDGVVRGVTPLTLEVPVGQHKVTLRSGNVTKELPVSVRPNADLFQHVEMATPVATTGSLTVTSDPPGLAVTIDGKRHAATPLTVEGLAPGSHRVGVAGDGLSSQRSVVINAGGTASMVFSRATDTGESARSAGTVSVNSPIDVQLFQGKTLIGSSRTARLLLPAGSHTLTAVNEGLGFRKEFTVRVSSGSTVSLPISVPNGTLSVNALPWAEVSIDGKVLGETPIGNVSVPIGTYELLFRHPDLGERRATVSVAVGKPARIGIDMRK